MLCNKFDISDFYLFILRKLIELDIFRRDRQIFRVQRDVVTKLMYIQLWKKR